MVKGYGQAGAGRRLLMGAVLVLLILGLAPVRYTGWVSWFATPPRLLVVPFSSQLTRLSSWIRSPSSHEADPIARQDAGLAQTQILQLQQENARLRALLETKGVLDRLDSTQAVCHVAASIVGSFGATPGGQLRAKAGASDGVTKGTIAVAPGMQLVGRVEDVDARTCAVVPITSKSSKRISGIIFLNEAGGQLACSLDAVGNGTLRGEIESRVDPKTSEVILPVPGQYVRLKAEPPWPRSANMLVVGYVESVEQSLRGAGRKAVVVRPTLDPLDRVTEVLLRVEPSRDEGDKRK